MKLRIFILLILCLTTNCFAIQKNVNSQKWTIFAFDRTDNTAKTGDLGQITASIWKDGVEDVIADTNPTELAHGYYEFDLDQAETNGDYLVMDAVSATGDIQVVGCPMAVWSTAPAINTLVISNARVNVDVTAISTDTTAADNLELQYDGTGLIGDSFPFTQAAGAALGGGISIGTTMASVAVILGSEQNLSNASTSDDSRWTGDDDGSGAEFIFRCTPVSTSGIPVELSFEGYYSEPSGSTNGATLQVYNFNTVGWDTIIALTNSTKDEDHEVPLSHAHKAPGGGTLETVAYTIGDVMLKFKQDTQETGNICLLIDRIAVGFVNGLVTASDVVDEWESQANADPTGFKVNVIEINETTQTANDNGADINAILIDTAAQDTSGEIRTLMTGADTPVAKETTSSTIAGYTDDIGVAGAGLTAINLPNQTMDIIGNITGNLSGSVGTLTGGVDLVKIHGSAITETTSGRFATNWNTFFDNADSATAKTLDDVGGTAGLEVDVTKIHGTAINESTSGRIAGNFSTFWDNADAGTAKVVDNVGASAAGGGSELAINAGNLGDYKKNTTVYFIWRTIDQGGAAVNPSTAGTIRVYKNNGTGEVTAPKGITDTRIFDSLTGIHLCSIDLNANTFYALDRDYSVVLAGAVIDSQTVTAVIGTFSIEKKYSEPFWIYN